MERIYNRLSEMTEEELSRVAHKFNVPFNYQKKDKELLLHLSNLIQEYIEEQKMEKEDVCIDGELFKYMVCAGYEAPHELPQDSSKPEFNVCSLARVYMILIEPKWAYIYWTIPSNIISNDKDAQNFCRKLHLRILSSDNSFENGFHDANVLESIPISRTEEFSFGEQNIYLTQENTCYSCELIAEHSKFNNHLAISQRVWVPRSQSLVDVENYSHMEDFIKKKELYNLSMKRGFIDSHTELEDEVIGIEQGETLSNPYSITEHRTKRVHA